MLIVLPEDYFKLTNNYHFPTIYGGVGFLIKISIFETFQSFLRLCVL